MNDDGVLYNDMMSVYEKDPTDNPHIPIEAFICMQIVEVWSTKI